MKTYVVTIRTGGPGGGNLPGFLDMLRYDQAKVANWERSSEGPTVYVITLHIDEKLHTPDRWASFALYPKEVNR